MALKFGAVYFLTRKLVSNLLLRFMDSLYKDALQKLRSNGPKKPSMFETSWNYIENVQSMQEPNQDRQELPISKPIVAKPSQEEPKVQDPDKAQTLNKLKEFSQKMLEESERSEVNINGASIKAVSNVTHEVSEFSSLAQIVEQRIQNYPAEIAKQKQDSLSLTNEKVKVFFVTDSLVEKAQFEADASFGSISCYFKPEVAKLFFNMTGALNLEQKDFYISSINAGSEDLFETLKAEIYSLKPQFIVTLGASATVKLLKSEQRLKAVHGQLFDVSFTGKDQSHESRLMPLFSPKLLHTAPNMKKTAWRDMQKLIEKLSV